MKQCVIAIDVERDLDTDPPEHSGVDILYESLQDKLDSLGAHATLFVSGEIATRCEGALKSLARQNEIASHGFRHVPVVSFDSHARRDDVLESRTILEQITGEQVHGFRCVKYVVDTQQILLLNNLRFAYDSSVIPRYPFFRKYVGYKGKAPREPYHPSEKDYMKSGQLPILELPVSSISPVNFPIQGTWLRYLGRFSTVLSRFSTDYLNVSLHSWDFVHVRRYGWMSGRKFADFIGDFLETIASRGYSFPTSIELVRNLTSGTPPVDGTVNSEAE